MNCPDVIELLPWYLNGSLEDAERECVDRHLRQCASCVREAELTWEVGEIFATHVPSEDLVAWADGSELDGSDLVASHLELCPMCSEEVELLRKGRPRARRLAAAGRFRKLAVAASLVLATGVAAWRMAPERSTVRDSAVGEQEELGEASTMFRDGFESGTSEHWVIVVE